ncbi:MAG TPA: DUF1579 family protein [Vicinamibacterales bacterium]|nr:DUF1579 family protein [Vicinamibacterales bacterium]
MSCSPTRLVLALVLWLSWLPSPGWAQTTNQEALMKEMQARMEEAARLGPHHAALGALVGAWDVELAMVMPGAPAQRSKGRATYAWAIEGRWLTQQITGELMGTPYQSFSLMGFDTYAKNHVVVSVTSMDTAMNMARGLVVDPTHQVTAVYGTLDEYTTGELHKPYKVVVRRASDARHVMEIWDLGIGDAGAKVLEFTFIRRP